MPGISENDELTSIFFCPGARSDLVVVLVELRKNYYNSNLLTHFKFNICTAPGDSRRKWSAKTLGRRASTTRIWFDNRIYVPTSKFLLPVFNFRLEPNSRLPVPSSLSGSWLTILRPQFSLFCSFGFLTLTPHSKSETLRRKAGRLEIESPNLETRLA